MKFRSTLILFLLAIALGTYIWLVESKRPSTKESQEHAQRVTELNRNQIDRISIKNTETKIVFSRKDNNAWYLEEPVKDRADLMALSQLFTTAETLKHENVLGADGKSMDKGQLKEFGLSNSETKIKFSGSGKPVELILGKDAAVEGRIYAKVEGADPVYVISNDLKNQISKKADDFRDRKLTELSTPQVHKVILKSGSGEIELEKKNQHWSLIKPLHARGDESKIGDLISQATTARIDTFVADSANLAAYGLEEPRGTVSLFTEGAKEPVILQIGARPKEAKPNDKTYAKLSSRNSVVLLPKSIEKLLETKPNDLRDKNLIRVESDIVDRITIESEPQEKLVIARSGENWIRKSDKEPPVNAATAASLLNALNSQQVTQFVADIATDLPKYGLERPRIKVTLSSYASENTAETKAGEKPIVTVFFGRVEGESVYAKIDDEPFIVSIHKAILDSIPTDSIRWQELSIYKFKPEEISSFELSRAGQPPLSFERDKEKWKLSKGDGNINQTNTQSLVNTLARLRAVRWTGPVLPEQGLENPNLTFTFKTTGNVTGKLMIGAATPDEMTAASANGLNGTFLISRPDKEAFELPLLDKPSALSTSPGGVTGTPIVPAPATTPPGQQ